MTVHVPRRPYVEALPGIPTIRVFEALACGIPLICSPWDDAEGLFSPGSDYLIAQDGREMREQMGNLIADPESAQVMARRGRDTILGRHTCAHRVAELLDIIAELNQSHVTARAPGHCQPNIALETA
jgi:spore maturation protein CgeB